MALSSSDAGGAAGARRGIHALRGHGRDGHTRRRSKCGAGRKAETRNRGVAAEGEVRGRPDQVPAIAFLAGLADVVLESTMSNGILPSRMTMEFTCQPSSICPGDLRPGMAQLAVKDARLRMSKLELP